MALFTFTVTTATEDKFSGGMSFIEDIAADRFNVDIIKAVTVDRGTVITTSGTDSDIASFIKYLRNQPVA